MIHAAKHPFARVLLNTNVSKSAAMLFGILDKIFTAKTRNGILLIDNADDANWYRFITEKAFRDNTPNAFGLIDPYDFIMKLANLENRYTSKYEELNDLVKQLDGIINPDKKANNILKYANKYHLLN